MLTLQDVVELLKVIMPRKRLSVEEVVDLIYQKEGTTYVLQNCPVPASLTVRDLPR